MSFFFTVSKVGKQLLLFLSFTADIAEPQPQYGAWISGLPTYRKEEIEKHNSMESRIWVTFNHGVYDVTDFFISHPGMCRSNVLLFK